MKELLWMFISLAILCIYSEAAKAQSDLSKVEVGAQFTLIHTSLNSTTEPGLGGRLTFNVTDHVALEAEVNFFPREDGVSTNLTGGRITQGLFGVKAGKRFEKVGVFAKVRPGFISYGRTITGVNANLPPPSGFQFGRTTYFAIDIGGVVELYPSRRVIIRFDAGDTIIRYPAQDVPSPLQVFPPPPPTHIPGFHKHNFQFSSGVGIRF